jgi:hypothetical protein
MRRMRGNVRRSAFGVLRAQNDAKDLRVFRRDLLIRILHFHFVSFCGRTVNGERPQAGPSRDCNN